LARPKTRASQRKAQNSFPVWLIVAGGVILLAVAAWALLNRGGNKTDIEVTGAPGIKVDQEVFDYGDVKLGEKPIRTVVRVTNVGDQTLRITEAPYVEVLEGC
jgi:hypothetical protein